MYESSSMINNEAREEGRKRSVYMDSSKWSEIERGKKREKRAQQRDKREGRKRKENTAHCTTEEATKRKNKDRRKPVSTNNESGGKIGKRRGAPARPAWL